MRLREVFLCRQQRCIARSGEAHFDGRQIQRQTCFGAEHLPCRGQCPRDADRSGSVLTIQGQIMRIQSIIRSIAVAAACRRHVFSWAVILPIVVLLGTPAFAVKPYPEGEGGSSDPYPPGVGEGTNPSNPKDSGPASTPDVSITGRVNSLRAQKANNPI